jgi:hypothetical protein
LYRTLSRRLPAKLSLAAFSAMLDEDLVHVVSEILQPEHVSMFCAPITTLDPSRNVATPRALLVV